MRLTQSASLPETFVDSLSGPVQRKLLKALNGQGHVPISKLQMDIYGIVDEKSLEALLKAKNRLNRVLKEMNAGCVVQKHGETLILTSL
jgi:hypothetical protein